MRDVGQEFRSVDVGTQATGGFHHGHAVVGKLLHQVLDEDGALVDDFLIEGLHEAHGHGFHGAHFHTAVGQEALVQRDECLHLEDEALVVGDDGTTAGETELAAGEVDEIHLIRNLADDFGHRHILCGFLAGLDEVQVVLQQRGIQHGHDAVFLTHGGHIQHVLHGKRLTANQVGTGFDTHKGNMVSTHLFDEGAQTGNIEVALEGVFQVRVEALGDDELLHAATLAGDVGLRGGEVEVHGYHIAFLHEGLGQDVLAGAALVGGQEILGTEHMLNHAGEAVEGLGTGVGVVSLHGGGNLVVAHGVHTGVGEHIHEHILILQQERVVAGLAQLLHTLFDCGQEQLLHHTHLVHFQRHLVLFLIELDNRHDECFGICMCRSRAGARNRARILPCAPPDCQRLCWAYFCAISTVLAFLRPRASIE